MKRWDYRYELTDFKRDELGICSYHTRQEGKIPYDPRPFYSSSLLLKVWRKAREEAERTGRDIVIYVFGNQIVQRVKPVSKHRSGARQRIS